MKHIVRKMLPVFVVVISIWSTRLRVPTNGRDFTLQQYCTYKYIYIYSTNIFIYTEYFTMLSGKTLECVGVCVVVKLKAQLRTVSEQSSTRNALGYISQLRKISRFVTAMEFRSSRLFASTL